MNAKLIGVLARHMTKYVSGNCLGTNSPVFQRDNAVLTIGDFLFAKQMKEAR